MIVVTGGAGFIGANLVKALNARGHDDVLVVDDLTDGTQFVNLADCTLGDYLDKDDFLARVKAELRGEPAGLPPIEAISTRAPARTPPSGTASSCSTTTSSIPRCC